ncbi:MAG: methionyl-tRNA formyltransferase [Saprospiraceae bacterium]|nr:methionyl-tRNA formyltransferase [Saprospiraceae bacterium]
MKIIFMGTPEFAVPSLDILIKNRYDVVAVVTSVDSFGGRGGKQQIESAVKKYAVAHNIPVLQPANLKSPEFISSLKLFEADIQIVVAFRMLPEIVWNMPPLGTFNLHGSLLPKYRGAAPIHHAVMNGETETGVTSFKLKQEIDTGDILIQRALSINETDTTGVVHDKLMILGAEVVVDTIKMISSGKYNFLKQRDAEATKAPKLFHNICEINFKQEIQKVYNFIRGLSPHPAAWCRIDGREMKVLWSTKEPKTDLHPVGHIITENKKLIKIKCQDGYIIFEKIKPEGNKVMSVSDFLNGHKIVSEMIN